MADALTQYLDAVQLMQTRVFDSQRELLQQIAARMADTIARDGHIYLFGTGHSSSLAVEAHHRAGGLAAVVPILATNLMLHESTLLATDLERTAGIAAPLLERYQPRADDMLFVFSNSGVNQTPVEMAHAGKTRGLWVVAVCAMEYAKYAPRSTFGKRLYEVADWTIDNGGVIGDAVVPLEGRAWRVAPTSTVIGALLWNALVAQTAYLLNARGITPPIFISSNVAGANEHNAALQAAARVFNPHF